MVHGPGGVKPRNWQPNTDTLHATLADGLVVVELKRGKATHEAVHQLARYVEQVKTNQPANTRVRGLLIAPDATGPALKQLAPSISSSDA